ncbi:hypothetical protein SLS60_000238 [Paraconiothyrium brasiliense]|uniref:Myb-like domain-containing protein n=1 Tax=Paraconiothyrium brasiliense TaxID=300254 RepID=A0ABR3S5R5_9PLEO
MEPRIATLLGDSPLERLATDALSRPPPPPSAPRKPHPVEPTTANDHVHANTPSTAPSLLGQSHIRHQHSPSQEPAPKRQKPSAPIASVLNTVTPFSGRLSDLLLDPSQQQAPKRKRIDESNEPLPPTGPENSLLTLPKPHQQPKKNTKRPRIPPLLQGLHQVPPQAQSRLFPPITSESGAFSRDRGEGAALRTTSGTEKRKEQGSDTALHAASGDGAAPAQEDAQIEAQRKAVSASTSDEENRAATGRSPASTTPTATKELRKRNKWSEKETKDLLVGVSRFGIGSWKKILQCTDFTFNQRTAVDLKDRFRTCCPGEGLKARKPKRKGDARDDSSQSTTVSSATTSMSSNQDPVAQESLDTVNSFRKNRGDTHRKGPAELREMGIHGSFTRSNRRERRPFTEQDDVNLLRGFDKYASSWHLIRDDRDLGFSTRQPTDLRDRFRIRYPEMFAKAGYKLKPKDEAMLKEKEKGKNKEAANSQTSANSKDLPSSSRAKDSGPDTSFSSLTSTSTPNSNLMPLALRESFLTSFTGPLDDFGDLDSEADGDHSRSPIILNRNIFEWADANPSQMTAVTSASLPSMGSLTSDAPLSMPSVTEATHINPMITLNLPISLLNSNLLSSATTQPSSSHAAPSSRLSDLYHHPISAAPASAPAAGPSTATTKHTTDPILRTPNLPTIVFPHVPASSARSAVHNLPPPADLLSGLDPDARPEAQTGPFMLDESLGFAGASTFYTSGATLAPMNSMPGREMLTLEKGLLQEPGRGGRGS